MRLLGYAAVFLFVVMGAEGCRALPNVSQSDSAAPPALPEFRVHSPAELDVVVSASGRPYEVQGASRWQPANLVRTEIGELMTGDGGVRILDGNLLELGAVDEEQHSVVEFEVTDLQVAELMLHLDGVAHWYAGTIIEDPSRSVERWGDFEFAFGTDGGMGALLADAALPVAREWRSTTDWSTYFVDTIDSDPPWLDRHATDTGFDSFVFGTGGDGAFPMSRGFAADGTVAAVVIWGETYPWRLAFPEVEPPQDVVDREQQLVECLSGQRGVTQFGYCTAAD